MKKCLIIIAVIFVAAFSISTGFTYDNSADGTTYQRGWPVGYYQYVNAPNSGPVDNLCGGADLAVGGNEQCAAARAPAISRARIAMNAAVWLAISSAVGGSLYFLRRKSKQHRA